MNHHLSWTAKFAALGLVFVLLISTLSAQERRIYSADGIDYAPKEAQFLLTAADLTENLDYIEYSIDGGEMIRYEDPVRIEEEGRHFITYRAVDITGNVSREKVYTVVIDGTAPSVSASAVGPAYVDEEGTAYLTSETAVILEAADRLSGVRRIYVSMDNEEFLPYTGPTHFEEEGEHTGYAYAVDNVGNRTETFRATGFVDNTAPAVSVLPSRPFRTFGGERYLASGSEILVRANDRLSGVESVEVSVNGRPFQSYSAPIQVSGSGFYSIRGRATDRVGNSSRAQEISFYVGVETPEPSIQPLVD
jgi:hypothetical protein